ncbi:MAG: hypothetical protein VX246_15950 [Myxococcota bacterium]|nr:hypothetical protein [Myxococcota bacterium]
MRISTLAAIGLMVAFATPSLATVKVYSAHGDSGTPGDGIGYTTTLCPAIKVTAGVIQGSHELTDGGGGTVSMTGFNLTDVVYTNIQPPDLNAVFGPGSFVFVTASASNGNKSLPAAGSGSTAPGGSIAWGVISGFTNTGLSFCISSPQTICTGGAMIPHGITGPLGPINSPTYDLGTWSFDAEGDLTASQYINRTNNGGTSNGQRLIRGAYVGAAVPALPLVGMGALALGFLVAGTRSVMRKK